MPARRYTCRVLGGIVVSLCVPTSGVSCDRGGESTIISVSADEIGQPRNRDVANTPARVDRITRRLLRRHVRGGPEDHADHGLTC